jgi:hypothetical protein
MRLVLVREPEKKLFPIQVTKVEWYKIHYRLNIDNDCNYRTTRRQINGCTKISMASAAK